MISPGQGSLLFVEIVALLLRFDFSQVHQEAEQMIEIADRLGGILGQIISITQLLKKLAAMLNPQSGTELVAENEIEFPKL